MLILNYTVHILGKFVFRRSGFMLIELLVALLCLSFLMGGIASGYAYYARLQAGVNIRLHALMHARYVAGKIQSCQQRDFSSASWRDAQWIEEGYRITVTGVPDAQNPQFLWFSITVDRVESPHYPVVLIVGAAI